MPKEAFTYNKQNKCELIGTLCVRALENLDHPQKIASF